MKALIHIGTGKTGTTSVQAFLRSNEQALPGQGLLYPVRGGDRNQWPLALAALDPGRPHFITNRRPALRDAKVRAATVKAWLDKAFAEADAHRDHCHTTIFSTEYLSDLREGEIKRLHKILAPHFESFRIVVYLRDPVDYAVSMYDTALKVGQLQSAPEPASLGGGTDYKALLTGWVNVFGQENLVVRLFDKSELQGRNILDDFAAVAGLNPEGLPRPDVANTSLDVNGQAILQRVNLLLKKLPPGPALFAGRRKLIDLMEKHFTAGPRLTASAEFAAHCDGVLAASNEWVRSRFFPNREQLFPPRTQGGPPVIPDPQIVESTAQVLAAMITAQMPANPR